MYVEEGDRARFPRSVLPLILAVIGCHMIYARAGCCCVGEKLRKKEIKSYGAHHGAVLGETDRILRRFFLSLKVKIHPPA